MIICTLITNENCVGGVTTVIDMPLNSIPPTTTVANLGIKCKTATGKCWVDVGFHGGIIPGNQVILSIVNVCATIIPIMFMLSHSVYRMISYH